MLRPTLAPLLASLALLAGCQSRQPPLRPASNAAPHRCPAGHVWNGAACEPERGIIINNLGARYDTHYDTPEQGIIINNAGVREEPRPPGETALGARVTSLLQCARPTPLRVGDVIIELDDEPVTSAESLDRILTKKTIGAKARVVVLRDGAAIPVEVLIQDSGDCR